MSPILLTTNVEREAGVLSMFGLQELVPSWEAKLLATVLVPAVAIGIAYLVRRGRRPLAAHVNPVVVDLASSVVIVGIVLATALTVADVWGETETLLDQLGFLGLDSRAPQVVVTIIVLIATQIVVGIVARLLDDLTRDSQALTQHQREVSLRLTQLTLWTGALIVILGVWNVDVAGLLVGAGFLGIVIGLAARRTLGSILSGIVLMFSRPFEVGDWVVVGEKEGIVSDITTMSTRILAFDGEYVVVPNDVVGNETITNRSRNGQLRVDVEVGVDYEADVQQAREVALTAATELAEGQEATLTSPPPDVLVRRFDDSAVVLVVRVWVDRPTIERVNRVRDEVICEIKERFDDRGIEIPYPQRELSGRGEAGSLHISTANESMSEPAHDGE